MCLPFRLHQLAVQVRTQQSPFSQLLSQPTRLRIQERPVLFHRYRLPYLRSQHRIPLENLRHSRPYCHPATQQSPSSQLISQLTRLRSRLPYLCSQHRSHLDSLLQSHPYCRPSNQQQNQVQYHQVNHLHSLLCCHQFLLGPLPSHRYSHQRTLVSALRNPHQHRLFPQLNHLWYNPPIVATSQQSILPFE